MGGGDKSVLWNSFVPSKTTIFPLACCREDNLLGNIVVFLPCIFADLSLSTLRLVHIVPRQRHIYLPVGMVHNLNKLVSKLVCSTRSSHIAVISTRDKFCCLPNFPAAKTSLFLRCIKWLQSASSIVGFWTFWTRQKSLLTSFLNTLGFKSKFWILFWTKSVLTFSKFL